MIWTFAVSLLGRVVGARAEPVLIAILCASAALGLYLLADSYVEKGKAIRDAERAAATAKLENDLADKRDARDGAIAANPDGVAGALIDGRLRFADIPRLASDEAGAAGEGSGSRAEGVRSSTADAAGEFTREAVRGGVCAGPPEVPGAMGDASGASPQLTAAFGFLGGALPLLIYAALAIFYVRLR